MIYVDTSVVLAHVLAEDRRPPDGLWDFVLIASRLVEYETWVRINRNGLSATHAEATRATLGRLRFLEMSTEVLSRAREPFTVPLRTLDALHLATCAFAQQAFGTVTVATYDDRLRAGARALSVPLYDLGADPATSKPPAR